MSASNQTFAQRYDSVLVPVIFRPWAQEMLRRAAPQDGEAVLDLACGTGIVSCELGRLGLRLASLTGIDHSADMLAVAKTRAEAEGLEAQWHQADAAALPLETDSIDLAICQQALQFFPDKPAALAELRRVLKPGGRAFFCVQRALALNPMLAAQAAALDAHVGSAAGDAVRAICSLGDGETLRKLFEQAGFSNVSVESVALTLSHPDGRAYAAGAMGGMHTGDKLSPITEAQRQACFDAFLAGLGDCYDGQGIRFPHVSHVVQVTA